MDILACFWRLYLGWGWGWGVEAKNKTNNDRENQL